MIAVTFRIKSELSDANLHESYFILPDQLIEKIEKKAHVTFTAFDGQEAHDTITFTLEFDPPLDINEQPGPDEATPEP
jgi:hypothetical protein